MFRTRYRIVKDDYCGFEVQFRYWWLFFWIECHSRYSIINTHTSIESAKEFLEAKKKKIVYCD